MLVIAGPNGSGKTTLTDHLIAAGVDFGEYINPDEIAKAVLLPEPGRSRQAQEIADVQRDDYLARRVSFSFETVMSHPSKIDFMHCASSAGYDVTLYFICTSDPAINVSRVENRVRKGGHDVPHERVVARYRRSLALLIEAVLVAHHTVLIDNSALVGGRGSSEIANLKAGLRPVGEIFRHGVDFELALEVDVPEWVTDYLVKPMAELAGSSGRISLAARLRK